MPSPATHLRAPLLWLLVPLMGGLTAARFWPAPGCGLWPLALGAAAAGLGAAACAFRPGRLAMVAWAALTGTAAGLGGFMLLHSREPAAPDERTRPPREVTLTLEVRQVFRSTPTARQLSGLAMVSATNEQDRELMGRLLYYSAIRRISVPPQRSGRYVVRGVLEPLPLETRAGFTDYLANLGVRHRLVRAHVMSEAAPPGRFQAFCVRAHDRLKRILQHGLAGQPQAASLYLAMLLGEKAELSPDQENAYMRSGTFHIFSISGLHVMVIAAALYVTGNLLRIPRQWAAVAGLVVLWLYVQITGASSPAVRAFIMIAFLTMYRSFRLPGNPLAGLTAAALATLVIDPRQLFSTGFQMSYTVVTALITMCRPLSEKGSAAWRPFALLPLGNWRWHHRVIDWGGRKLIFSAAACWTAFLASTPSGIGYFQLFSPGSLLANLVIIPLSTVAMWAGFASLVLGLAGLLPLSAGCNLLAALVVSAMDWALRHGTALPATWFNVHYRADWLTPVSLVLMTAVFLAGSAGRWAPRYGGYWPPVALLALLMIFGVQFD